MRAPMMRQFVTPDTRPTCGALFLYRGVLCSQTPRVLPALDALSNALAVPAQTIVEIGTFNGGFTRVLADHDISKWAEIHTFDIKEWVADHFRARAYVGDVFSDKRQAVIDLVQRPGKCLVFCDGGNKEEEVRTFCPYLKAGDLILCHDYCKVPEMLRQPSTGGDWPGCESQYANVREALETNGFVPFLEETMQLAMWGCWARA